MASEYRPGHKKEISTSFSKNSQVNEEEDIENAYIVLPYIKNI